MLRQPVLGIGWDVGGWIGRRQAVAVAEWNNNSAQWRGTPMRFSIADLGERGSVDDLVRYAWPTASSAILQTHELVMAIDAPLGFPVAFSELLARRSTPSIDPGGAEIDNPLAYRETDRHIYRTFLKKPLSGSFDKLGNNATVAMVHTRRPSVRCSRVESAMVRTSVMHVCARCWLWPTGMVARLSPYRRCRHRLVRLPILSARGGSSIQPQTGRSTRP